MNLSDNTWVVPTADDLNTFLNAPQLEALQTAALGEEQPDPVATALAAVVEWVRAEVRAGGNRASQTAGAIPSLLWASCAALAIEQAQARLPAFRLTADQIRLAREARLLLRRIAGGAIPVPLPNDPEAAPVTPGLPVAQVVRQRIHSQTLKI